jgi:hypothetical protein
LEKVFGSTYKPISVKVNFESKNAFITANTKDEAETFVRQFKEISIKEDTNLFFNLFRSRQERTQSMSYLKKKYNNFDEGKQMGGQGIPNRNPKMGGFQSKNYNDFGGMSKKINF